MTPSRTTMRVRAATLDATITATGPDAGSAEVSAVMAQLRDMIAGIEPEPEVLVVVPRRNRAARRREAAQRRKV